MEKRIIVMLPVVAATIVVISFGLDYLGLRSDVRSLDDSLVDCRDRNSSLISLAASMVSDGRANLSDLLPLLSEAQAEELTYEVEQAVELALPVTLGSYYYPSGWMGDGKFGDKYISIRHVTESFDGRDVIAMKIEYNQGPEGWAGIYWQYPDGNWGDKPGRTISGAKAITFIAKGAFGGEIVEFKSGGIRGLKYTDSFEATLGKVGLEREWKRYRIDLSDYDLTNVIGAFNWVAGGTDNKGKLIVYIADIQII